MLSASLLVAALAAFSAEALLHRTGAMRNFLEWRLDELRRKPLPRTPVNKLFLGSSPTSRPVWHPPLRPSRTDPRSRPLPRTGVAPPRSLPKLPHAQTRATRRASGGARQTTLARSERTPQPRTSVAARAQSASALPGSRPVGMPLQGRRPHRD